MRFKTLWGSLEGKAQRGQYLLVVGLGRYNPTSGGEENETFFIRVWKLLSSRRILKQRGRYLLAMGLGHYNPTSVGEENEIFSIRV